jgi:hypothetical protein
LRVIGLAVALNEELTIANDLIGSSLQGRSGEASKSIKNGQLLIERNGKTYNAQGAEIK